MVNAAVFLASDEASHITGTHPVADIPDGASLAVGGFGLSGVPEVLIGALHAQRTGDLRVVSNYCGVDGRGLGVLLADGRIARVTGSYALLPRWTCRFQKCVRDQPHQDGHGCAPHAPSPRAYLAPSESAPCRKTSTSSCGVRSGSSSVRGWVKSSPKKRAAICSGGRRRAALSGSSSSARAA